MSSTDQLNFVGTVELADDVAAEKVPSSTRAQAPTVDVLRIRPHEITHGAIVWDFLFAIQSADLVHRVDGRRQPTVYTKDSALDESGDGKVVKNFSAVAPNVDRAILAQTLVVKPVHLRNLPTFVVSSDESDSVWVSDL